MYAILTIFFIFVRDAIPYFRKQSLLSPIKGLNGGIGS